jgi:rhodanese-related sulfurtransferase
MRVFHWHDVPGLPRDGSVQLLDVRTRGEYAKGHIEGFINMPLDDVRGCIGELTTSKPVYVSCRIGLRGYLAARILSQNGFEVYNLSGGQRLYDAVY